MLTRLTEYIETSLVHNINWTHTTPYRTLVEAASATDPLSTFLQYGVLGLVVIGFITGWIVPGPTAKQLSAENQRLAALFENKILPMTEQYAATMERAAAALEKATDAMDRQADRDRLLLERARAEHLREERALRRGSQE